MSEIDFTGVALVVTALGSLVAAVGAAIVIIMTARQKLAIEKQTAILEAVEKQSNAVSLEGKRTTMVALRLLAESPSGKPEDKARAADAEKVYEEAKAILEKQKQK